MSCGSRLLQLYFHESNKFRAYFDFLMQVFYFFFLQVLLMNTIPLPERQTYAANRDKIRNLLRLRTVDPTLVTRRRDAICTIAAYILRKGYVIKGGFVRDMILHSGICNDLDINSGIDCSTIEGREELDKQMKTLIRGIEKDIPLVISCSTEFGTQYVVSMKLTHALNKNWQIELQFKAGILY